jgi:molybdopterin converting factor small subunit
LLDVLDRRYPGMRHRIVDETGSHSARTSVFFVNGDMAGSLDHTLSADDEVMIVAALSGGLRI